MTTPTLWEDPAGDIAVGTPEPHAGRVVYVSVVCECGCRIAEVATTDTVAALVVAFRGATDTWEVHRGNRPAEL